MNMHSRYAIAMITVTYNVEYGKLKTFQEIDSDLLRKTAESVWQWKQ